MIRLILTSHGLNSTLGCRQILSEIKDEELISKTIFLVTLPEYEVDERIADNCAHIMGFQRENLFFSVDGIPDRIVPDYVYVTEGDPYEVLRYMQIHGLVDYLREVVRMGSTYIGASAGANIGGRDIMMAQLFKKNYYGVRDYTALGLFDGTIIPHFTERQLESFLDEVESTLLNRYNSILSVANDEIVIIVNGKVNRRNCRGEDKG